MNLLFPMLALVVPPLLAFLVPSKLRAVMLGTVWVWFTLIAAGQYQLAADPNYDSVAPGLTLVAGWIPGVVYSLICVVAVTVIRSILRVIAERTT